LKYYNDYIPEKYGLDFVDRYPIVPVPKPRMVRSDTWVMSKGMNEKKMTDKERKRWKTLKKYIEFKDQCKKLNVILPWEKGYKVIFYIPFPKSYSNKKKI